MSSRWRAKGNKISKEQNCKVTKREQESKKESKKQKMIELFNPQVCVRAAFANL